MIGQKLGVIGLGAPILGSSVWRFSRQFR